jgi:hypothetical protein
VILHVWSQSWPESIVRLFAWPSGLGENPYPNPELAPRLIWADHVRYVFR